MLTIDLPTVKAPPRSSITREPLTLALWAELQPLIHANHAATGSEAPLAVDSWTVQGMAPFLWLVRVDERPVGYCAHAVQAHPLYGEKWATCIALYVDPAHRMLVRSLIARVEADLAGERVACISYGVPHLSRAGAFFEAIGYPCMELVMGKRLQ